MRPFPYHIEYAIVRDDSNELARHLPDTQPLPPLELAKLHFLSQQVRAGLGVQFYFSTRAL